MEDVVEAGTICFCEEDVVRGELWNGGAERPVKGNAAARSRACAKGGRVAGRREEMVVGVNEVGVVDDHVGSHMSAILESDPCCVPAICGERNGSDGGGKMVSRSQTFRYASQCLQDLVKSTSWIPNTLSKLCILQQRVSGRSIKRRHAHIHGREGKGTSKTIRIKVTAGSSVD